MIRRHILLITAATCAFVSLPAAAGAQTVGKHRLPGSWVQQKPEPPKPPASVAGKWNVAIEGQNGPIEAALDLKTDPKDAKKITGTVTSQMGAAALAGEYVDGKLSFGFSMDANGQSLQVTFTGAMQKDDTLAGTLSFGQGDLKWTAVRAK